MPIRINSDASKKHSTFVAFFQMKRSTKNNSFFEKTSTPSVTKIKIKIQYKDDNKMKIENKEVNLTANKN